MREFDEKHLKQQIFHDRVQHEEHHPGTDVLYVVDVSEGDYDKVYDEFNSKSTDAFFKSKAKYAGCCKKSAGRRQWKSDVLYICSTRLNSMASDRHKFHKSTSELKSNYDVIKYINAGYMLVLVVGGKFYVFRTISKLWLHCIKKSLMF